MTVSATVTMRDAKNQTAVTRFYVADGEGPADQAAAALAIRNALNTASNAVATAFFGADVVAPTAGSSSGKWIDVEDKCKVYVQTASGAVHIYEIPAPKDTCFLPDGETMDGAGPGQAFGVAVVANCVTRDGTAFASVIGGSRDRVKLQRRFNIRTRNSALTGQGL